jgi:hypothetical protein
MHTSMSPVRKVLMNTVLTEPGHTVHVRKVRFEFLPVMTMKITLFRNVIPFSQAGRSLTVFQGQYVPLKHW